MLSEEPALKFPLKICAPTILVVQYRIGPVSSFRRKRQWVGVAVQFAAGVVTTLEPQLSEPVPALPWSGGPRREGAAVALEGGATEVNVWP